MKEQNLFGEDWNTLIILDACRYDFFEKVYRDYIDGKLEKRISPASHTVEWLEKSFPHKYDVTYISANPFINSFGIPLNKLSRSKTSWKATDHILKIIDVWQFGWDESLNTVHPNTVNAAYFANRSNKKTIVHYLQPHTPYLSHDSSRDLVNFNRRRLTIENKGEYTNQTLYKYLRGLLARNLHAMLGTESYWRIRKTLNLPPWNILEWFWRRGQSEEILFYYEDNLKQVLDSVRQLIANISGKIIVTSDHGEAFGEQGIWGHEPKLQVPVLREVPWLKIEK